MAATFPVNLCYGIVTLSIMFASPSSAAVAYIQNCCNNPSSVSVIDTATGQQKAVWTVGSDAYQAIFSPNGRIAYVSGTVAEAVSVVQVATGTVLATIPVGYQISWMAITPNGSTLFAQSYDGAYFSHIVEIDTITNTIERAVEFNASLSPMVVSADGKHLYTDTAFPSSPLQQGLLVLDTVFLAVQATIPMGAANGLAVSPDGRFVYVPNLGMNGPYAPNVAVVDTSTNTVTATIPLDTKLNPGQAQVSPDGSMLWVSEFPLYSNVDPVVAVISTSTNQVEAQFTLKGKLDPGAIVFAPDGKVAWVVAGGAAVDAVGTVSWETLAEIDTQGGLAEPAISPDGKTLLLPNSGDSQVAAFGVSGRLASIPAGAMNWSTHQDPLFIQSGGAAAAPDGSRIYVTNQASNNVNIIDTGSKQVIRSVEAGAEPVAVAISPDGSHAYVANSFDSTITVIDTKSFHTTQIAMPNYTYPSALAVAPDGSRVYVAGNNPIPDFGNCGCRVFVLDTSSNKVAASIRLDYPQALVVSPDGTKLYVVSAGTALYTISTATNKIINQLAIPGFGPGGEPATSGIAITPDGARIFVDDGGDNKVFEIDTAGNKIIDTILVGNTPGILALTPDANELWVGDYNSTYASVIDISNGTVSRTILLGNQSYGITFASQ